LRDWYEKTALPVFTGILPQKLQPQTFYNAMDYLTDPAILRIQKELFRNVQRIYGIDTSKVFYDLTSTYFEGTKCPMGEFGHSTEHRPDKKQVNIGLAVDRDGIPIVHEVFGGSTRDVTTVQGFAERLKIEFGIQAPIIVIDRGMVSRDNLDALLELGYDYIVARKMGPTEKRIVTGISDDEYVKGIVTDVLHKKEIWTRETEVDGKRLIVCWNKEKAIDDKTFRDAMITKTEEKLRKIEERCGKGSLKKKDEVYHKTYSILEKYDTKQFFDISINQRGSPRMSFVLRLSAIEKAQRLDGKFILETSDTSLTPIEVVRSYRDRDAVEKFFQTLKDIVELRPVYVYTEQHVKAHVFICVLAVLLLAIIRKVLKEANKDLTSIKALGILDGIKRVEFSIGNGKGIVVRTTEFNNQQREIISLLNVVPIGL
jgi:transposase